MADEFEDEDAGGGGGGAGWMATFADMMTLLLTFFVLLISFANMDVVKFQMMLGSVKDAMGVQYQHPGQIPAVSTTPVPLSETESSAKLGIADPNMAILNAIRQSIEDAKLEGLVEAELGERGVIVRVKGQVLFDLGDVTLKPDGLALLDTIGGLSREFDTNLMIEGHTDGLPISTSQYPSNWELSTGRAISAMRYFVGADLVPNENIGVAGYADARPVAPNDTAEGRAQNRRIEFVFVSMSKSEGTQARARPILELTPSNRIEPGAVPFGPPNMAPFDAPQPPPAPSND